MSDKQNESIPTPRTDAQCGCNWSREMERELAAARAEVEVQAQANRDMQKWCDTLRAEVEGLRAVLARLCSREPRTSSQIDADWDAARAALAKEKA